MIARRALLAGGTAAAGGPAQERVRRISLLRWNCETPDSEWASGLQRRLAELGWIVGRNLAIGFGWADGDGWRADSLVAAMLRAGTEVIVAASAPAVRAAMAATNTVPIVMAPAADPLANGFVASLARPGGIVTGVSAGGPDLAAKWVELVREAVPGLTRLGCLGAARDPTAPLFAAQTLDAGARLGIAVSVTLVDTPAELPAAFAEFAAGGAQALVVQPLFVVQRGEVAALALHHRLPTIAELRPVTEAGLLMSYGTSNAWYGAAGADYVDRILRGAAPADLPVERSTRIALTINRRTARALGLALPQSLLQRADEVIE